MIKISYSQLKKWRHCKSAHHYQYGLKLRSRRIKRPLDLGNLGHIGLEADAEMLDPWEEMQKEFDTKMLKVFTAEQEMYREILADANDLVTGYFTHWAKEPINYLKIGDRHSEHKFEHELAKGVVLKGKVDGVEHEERFMWVVEHKFKKAFPDEEERWRDLQSALYAEAFKREYSLKIGGVLWDYIRSKSPSRPTLKKDGSVSERALDTLPHVYIEECRKLGVKPSKTMILSLREKYPSWYKRIRSPLMPNVSTLLIEQFVETARQVSVEADEMNISYQCRQCSYQALCRARLMRLDFEEVAKNEFSRREDEDPDTLAPEIEG